MDTASTNRYQNMKFRLCGSSGLKLPLISLGLWQNFGEDRPINVQRSIVHRAFDLGVTHFDLANNYGPPIGEAETNFGRILKGGLIAHREELIVSTKAGYRSWPGPYGDGGSRKNIITSCEFSLRRTGLEFFDIFYHHRMDSEVPVEETMAALEQLVRQGKALYVGVSSHTGVHLDKAATALSARGFTRLTSLMSRYNLLQRGDEIDKWPFAVKHGMGGIAFSPLAQGLLSKKYLNQNEMEAGRMIKEMSGPKADPSLPRQLDKARALNAIAEARGQTLAQMAIAWLLKQPIIASALIGASSVAQLEENVGAINNLDFTDDELTKIDSITKPNPPA